MGYLASQPTERPLLRVPQEDPYQPPVAQKEEEGQRGGGVRLLSQWFLEPSLLLARSLSPPRNAGRIQSGFLLSTPPSLRSSATRCLHPPLHPAPSPTSPPSHPTTPALATSLPLLGFPAFLNPFPLPFFLSSFPPLPINHSHSSSGSFPRCSPAGLKWLWITPSHPCYALPSKSSYLF